jgi:hypothetical protein
VWRVSALRFSDLLIGLTTPLPRAALTRRLTRVAPPLRPALPRAIHGLRSVARTSRPWTDDRAPVEWLTDRMLAEQIATGHGLDEDLLPTVPAAP